MTLHRPFVGALDHTKADARQTENSRPREGTAQIVPYADSAPLSAKLLKNGKLKTYKGFPHGMPTTEAATINKDLLAFVES